MGHGWLCIAAARARNTSIRVPFCIDGQRVGSVARAHLPTLQGVDPRLQATASDVRLDAPAAQRDALFASLNQRLHDIGLIKGWRGETYAIVDPTGMPLALIERAAARFWGTLTLGAHANAYVADATGTPTHLWVARRSLTKATDPGMLDNLVGGGVPWGQTPFETLVREGWEEAGLDTALMRTATSGRLVEFERDVPEGLQHERIHIYDLAVAANVQPDNRDGEVESFRLWPVLDALALAASGQMTVDAALVTLDFALRRRLLPAPELTQLERAAAGLWVGVAAAA
jgi:8-oxo-dGTP pyrophosphatase MutT (NUDIX family)